MTSRVQLRQTAASILRNHFDTEASDAGLRSLDLASTGAKGSSSYDASAVARADRTMGRDKFAEMFGLDKPSSHRHVRASLKRLHPKHVEVLSLAYGNRLRTRDIEDGKKRRAVRQVERNWRVRLAELYGQEGLMVLASPLARKLFAEHMQALRTHVSTMALPKPDVQIGGIIPARDVAVSMESRVASDAVAKAEDGGLVAWLLDAGRAHMAQITDDARHQLNEALDAFADAHGITSTPAEPRRRSSEKTRARILASHTAHGVEIGG